MSRQTLKDAHYKVIGYIDTDISGKQIGKDAHFHTVGYYDPRSDRTTDAHFRVVAHGNTLASLIHSAC